MVSARIPSSSSFRTVGSSSVLASQSTPSVNPRKKVADIIGEGLVINHLCKNEEERNAKVARILEKVGLAPVKSRYLLPILILDLLTQTKPLVGLLVVLLLVVRVAQWKSLVSAQLRWLLNVLLTKPLKKVVIVPLCLLKKNRRKISWRVANAC